MSRPHVPRAPGGRGSRGEVPGGSRLPGSRVPGSRLPGEEQRLGAGQRPPRQLASLSTLMVAHWLSDGAGNYLPGVLPAVLIAFGLPPSMAGAMIAALSIGQVLQPVVGWVADKVGGRMLPPLGLLLTSVGGGLVPLAPNVTVLLALLLSLGVGSALFHPPSLAAIRRMPSNNTGLYISFFLVGGELGRGLWPTVASLITVSLGLNWLWLIALPGLAWLPVLLRLMPVLPAKPPEQRRRIRWRRHAGPASLLILFRGMESFIVLGLSAWIPVLWQARGDSMIASASVITTMITLGVLGNVAGGIIADRIGRRFVLVTSGVVSLVLVFLIAQVPGGWVYPVAALLGMALFLPSSASILIGQDIFPENRSMGSGIALGLANGLGAIAVMLVGLAVTHDNVLAMFQLFVALTVVSVVVAVSFPRRLMR